MTSKNTACWVASLGCGCGVGICVDDGHWKEEVEAWRTEGHSVNLLPLAAAHEAFRYRCAKYPHMSWQKRNEKARALRMRAMGALFNGAKESS